ncbi:hypothetical protein LINPERHAP2_LOCUS17016 [Linum perenne]
MHLSDHCGLLTNMDASMDKAPSVFKFFNFWTKHPGYEQLIKKNWKEGRVGFYMEDLYSNLYRIKTALKILNKESFSDISRRVKEAEDLMLEAQSEALVKNDADSFKQLKEKTENWDRIKSMEEMFYKQKARISSIAEGDSNTKYFFNKVKARTNKKQIGLLVSADGKVINDLKGIAAEDVGFYENLLGKADSNRCCRAYGNKETRAEDLLGIIRLELGIMWKHNTKLQGICRW